MLFEKGDVDLPPAYDGPPPALGTSTGTLSSTSHGCTLSLPVPASGWYVPGDRLEVRLTLTPDVLGVVEGEIKCVLEGKSTVEVMGKQRYQKAQMVQASLGSNPVPITSIEEHLFASASQSLPPPTSYGGAADLPINLIIPQTRTCDCPPSKSNSGVLPTVGWKGSLGERNRVKWKLKVIVPRKGMLKRDIKMGIEVPISLPPPPPSKACPVTTQSKSLEGGKGELETTLTVLPSSPPGSFRRIPFQIHLRLSDPSLSSLRPGPDEDDSLKVSLGLCKHTWTKGIHTSVGSPNGHDFPGIMEGSLKLDKPDAARGTMRIVDTERGGGLMGEGEYQVEDGLVTAMGCGLRLSWSLQAQIRWKQLDAPMVVAQLIELPHYIAG